MERLTQWIGEDEDRRAIPRPDIRSNGMVDAATN